MNKTKLLQKQLKTVIIMINIQNIKFSKRNLLKNKTISLINIAGLSVGITVSMLIFTYVYSEYTTDRTIPDVEHIYALTQDGEAHMSYNLVNLMRNEIPEAKNITLCSSDWSSQVFLRNDENNFKIENVLCADSCFFRVFPFKAAFGNPTTALDNPNRLVITRELAKKIFGNENPVGKELIYNASNFQDITVQVDAVIEDLPANSSWNFDAAISLPTYFNISWYKENMRNWGTNSYNAFLRTGENVSAETLNKKLTALPKDKLPGYMKDIKLSSLPFLSVYFDFPQLKLLKHGTRLILSIILITGILIILLACINYANLVTAQREKRFKNIGIIKSLGSQRRNIVKLFATESVLSFLLAVIISVLLISLLFPFTRHILALNFDLQSFFSLRNLAFLFVVFALTITITGIIPGVVFSRYKAHLLLKKMPGIESRRNYLRNSMLVFQFAVSVVLIAGILFINRQYKYMSDFDTGFESENIVFANTNIDLGKNIQAFKNELENIAGINEITFCSNELGYISGEWGRIVVKNGEKEQINFAKVTVSPNFFNFFGMDILDGRGYTESSEKLQEYIFNEEAVKQYNLSTNGNNRVNYGDPVKGHVVGVVNDFNIESLHVPIRPAGFTCSNDFCDVVYFKTNVANFKQLRETMNSVEKIWNQLSPNFPFEYKFLDQSLEALYTREKQFQCILSFATIVSLLLSCLGLIGLSFFVMEQRTKEIGIRKVNGAKISEILTMLNKDFVKWVVIALIIATPIAYYGMSKWLENFAYKSSLNWWIFALAGILALMIALLTVSWQSWRAATKNPVEALRYE
ncbi:ABC transporter permease [Maribellus maritimus]|uniref:ABC transporter permease n=1 Tax=Maribellus maritimus TaxID=2870838 RepID=UPI001EEB59D5|nr:ABC transporter permease [Maribellus maritimus]MCG6189805.1 ABC transporter permease [Maribellus maritimus]